MNNTELRDQAQRAVAEETARLLQHAQAQAAAIIESARQEAKQIRQRATREALELFEAARREEVLVIPAASELTVAPVLPVQSSASLNMAAIPMSSGTGSIAVMASPFPSFTSLVSFQNALTALPGVSHVKMKRFLKGRLWLEVSYDGVVPLTDRVKSLENFDVIVVSDTADALDLRVAPRDMPDSPTDGDG